MAETQHDADIINADRDKQAKLMQEHLARMGVHLQIAHYIGDSSYPTEYTLSYGDISAVGPTYGLALLEFVEKLLKTQKKLASLRQWKQDWTPVINDWSDKH